MFSVSSMWAECFEQQFYRDCQKEREAFETLLLKFTSLSYSLQPEKQEYSHEYQTSAQNNNKSEM